MDINWDGEPEPGAEAVVLAMDSVDWKRAKGRVMGLLRRAGVPDVIEDVLERAAGELPRGTLWREQLRRFLEQSPPTVVSELGSVIRELHITEPERLMLTRNEVSGGAVAGNVVQAGSVRSLFVGDGHLGVALPTPDAWPRLSELAPLDLGVRTSRTFRDEPELPRYAARDCDTRLHVLAREAAVSGGLVVVTGEPLSGKTMTAYQTLLACLGRQGQICAPGPGTDLRTLPALLRGRADGPYALWLDDLEGHLGAPGLTPGLLTQLIQQRLLVVATMRDEEYEKHRFGSDASSRVLARAETVELASRWSEDELSRLADLSADDARLAGALNRRGVSGVTQYLAIGPELWAEWNRARRPGAHPRGHLLVRAAIDLARHGIDRPVPLDLLRSVHGRYGPEIADPRRESFEDALTWATETRHGVAGLLVPGQARGTWKAYGSLVADGARRPDMAPMPYSAWECVMDATIDGVPESTVVTIARAALLPAAKEGDNYAAVWLATFCREAGDVVEATRWYRAAADANPSYAPLAGKYLAEHGSLLGALPYLRTAAEAGNRPSAVLLGRLLRDEAEHWLRLAAQADDGEAAYELAGLLYRPGRPGQEADEWYARAAELGYAPAPVGARVRPGTVGR
ncbi:tetratricopeptide repeat protein [Streptomyces lushanensis]|uniref:tetratricopeptide repeat protein n=1 Tax=Streptomyces lushanensis TaxID=1434255 RepID=UPI00082AB1D6|nr:tetratricopeptide repeat protein [Streptomyces lushanensis]